MILDQLVPKIANYIIYAFSNITLNYLNYVLKILLINSFNCQARWLEITFYQSLFYLFALDLQPARNAALPDRKNV